MGVVMQCKYCHRELAAEAHGKRQYCNDACKQAYYRQRVEHDQQQDIEALRAQVERLEAEIKKRDEQIEDRDAQLVQMSEALTHLKRWINLEYLFLEDTQVRGFISSIEARRPRTPLIERILAHWKRLGLPPRADRYTFEAPLRIWLRATDEELLQFRDLWKLMMLDRSRDDF
jgi:hypothetical protein